MKRKIELDQIAESDFEDVLIATNTEILKIAKEAKDKMNELLSRFGVQCEMSLQYVIPSGEGLIEPIVKKKRQRKKKSP